ISEARVKEAQKNLSRQKTSAEVDIATKERALSLAKNDLEQSRIALKEAIAKTSELKIKEDDVIRAQTLLDKSDASRNQALDELSKTKIVSPVDGVIINRNVEIGDVVASQTMSSAAGTTLMTMADLSEIYAEANIDETDIGKVKKDLSVTITSAAYEDLKIPGFVSYIASQALQVEQIPTFKLEIKISLDKINKKDMPHGKDRYGLLFPGMSIDADIHVAKKEKVLQLPLEAIRDKDGKKYVTILKGEKSEEVEVKTGMKNNIMIEIISGVSEGDEIKIPKVDDRDGNKDKPVTAPGNRGQRRSVL
ncbi:MAG TPA: efflux RND transporter periplasmic adaptor subunit, partial [Candidatus Eremiobacteraeota bacterium]|nr:efflux RND transporter periplasmic adaptor subunit [Candidatus Eremiobacteraeota bacterium]